jgi:hypothetical protein
MLTLPRNSRAVFEPPRTGLDLFDQRLDLDWQVSPSVRRYCGGDEGPSLFAIDGTGT